MNPGADLVEFHGQSFRGNNMDLIKRIMSRMLVVVRNFDGLNLRNEASKIFENDDSVQ